MNGSLVIIGFLNPNTLLVMLVITSTNNSTNNGTSNIIVPTSEILDCLQLAVIVYKNNVNPS